jgi:hypothetical protein
MISFLGNGKIFLCGPNPKFLVARGVRCWFCCAKKHRIITFKLWCFMSIPPVANNGTSNMNVPQQEDQRVLSRNRSRSQVAELKEIRDMLVEVNSRPAQERGNALERYITPPGLALEENQEYPRPPSRSPSTHLMSNAHAPQQDPQLSQFKKEKKG